MKHFINIIILSLLLPFSLFASGLDSEFAPKSDLEKGVVERVYIMTDKLSYVAGDRLWCSLFCFKKEGESLSLSDYSSTVYLELQTNDKIVLTAKAALIEGRGGAVVDLPPTLPTGQYKLVGYTAQNRNEVDFVPEGKVFPIFNVLTLDRVEGGVIISPDGVEEAIPSQETYNQIENRAGSDEPKGRGEKVSISVKGDTDVLPAGQEFTLSISNNSDEALSFGFAVSQKDFALARTDKGVVNFYSAVTMMDVPQMINTIGGEAPVLPDYEGEVIMLQTSGVKDGIIQVSFPGESVDCYTSKVDSDGIAQIVTPNIYGQRDMICQGADNISIVDPFIRKVSGGIHPLRLSPSMEKALAKRGFAMQVTKRFDSDTLYNRLLVRDNIFLGEDKVVYKLDDYTRFPVMEEVLTEFVKEIRIRSVKGEKMLSILVNSLESSLFSTGYSLVMIDGVPVRNHQKILDFDPLLLERVEIYTGTYSIGGTRYEGVANFITYKKDMSGYRFEKDELILQYDGCSYPLSFTGERIVEGGMYPDFRETIYWHPMLEIDGGETLEIRCIAPLYEGDFYVVLEGVSTSGKPIYSQTSLKVK